MDEYVACFIMFLNFKKPLNTTRSKETKHIIIKHLPNKAKFYNFSSRKSNSLKELFEEHTT